MYTLGIFIDIYYLVTHILCKKVELKESNVMFGEEIKELKTGLPPYIQVLKHGFGSGKRKPKLRLRIQPILCYIIIYHGERQQQAEMQDQ